jgi:5'-nucleotidase
MPRPSFARPFLLVAAIALAVVATISPAGAHKPPKPAPPPADVRLLTINDLHGNLEPPTGSSGRIVDENGATVEAGGAAFLAAHIAQHRNANTELVAAGDLIGATPLISAAYHDEPTIEVLEALGLATSSAGNHEFDEGYAELLRIMRGGCHPVDGCSPAGSWDGSDFDFLAANVTGRHGFPALPPVHIERINGQLIAFIGLVTATTPTIVTSEGIEGLTFHEEVAPANFVSKLLRFLGVRAQVVLVHEGDQVTPGQSPDACPVVPGAGTRIAEGLDAEIDLIVTGHSHQAYVCKTVDPKGNDRYVTQGSSFGRILTQIDFQVDRKTHDIIRSSVTVDNHVVTRTVTPDATIAALVQTWKDRVAAVANQPIGSITAELPNVAAPSGEVALGNLIADAQLDATTTGGGAQIALMNPGGIRAGLTFASSPAGEGDGVVTYGEAFAVQPFNNLMQAVTLTGAQLKVILEQQFPGGPNAQPFTKILQPSANFRYTYSQSAAWGSKVSGMTIDGVPVTDTQTIRVAANNFLVGGGDAFLGFRDGTDLWSGPLDIDAFADYLAAHSPAAPPATNRITVVP